MRHYYNENDEYAAQWLCNLIAAGEIPAGDVDTRSIVDVQADDLRGFVQCHFFAGIGGWPLALKLAGWPDDRPVWTGSCPCQPFSGAGKQQGEKDKRHLWPEFLRLIVEWEVPTIFGEQVASRLGREWLTGVCADLEELDYVVGAADLCAAGAGAPHIRQRLYWVADAAEQRWHEQQERTGLANGRPAAQPGRLRGAGGLADGNSGRQPQLAQRNGQSIGGIEAPCWHDTVGRGALDRLADAGRTGVQLGRAGSGEVRGASSAHAGQGLQRQRSRDDTGHSSAFNFWSQHDVVHCTDGKARRFEPGSFPLAHGISNRVGRLRAYGNAIVPQVAKTFIEAYLDCSTTVA